jgi:hypothetical protein
MSDLTKRRLAAAEARFERYPFGAWEIEEAHHWHIDVLGDEFCRTVLFCAEAPGGPCLRGHFLVRFQPGGSSVVECHAMNDGCSIGNKYPKSHRKT